MNENIEILKEGLESACQASYVPNIVTGRKKILALPRQWVIKNIHTIAQEMLDLSDEWEYLRLVEVYKELDEGLLKMLIDVGLQSKNEDIKGAADHYRQNHME